MSRLAWLGGQYASSSSTKVDLGPTKIYFNYNTQTLTRIHSVTMWNETGMLSQKMSDDGDWNLQFLAYQTNPLITSVCLNIETDFALPQLQL